MHSSNVRTRFGQATTVFAAISILLLGATASFAASVIDPPSTRNTYGWGGCTVSSGPASGAPAQPILTYTTQAKSSQPWNNGAGEGLNAPVSAGEKLTATFYIRAVSPATVMTDFSFEKSSAPFKSSVRHMVTAGKTWQKVTIPFAAAAAYTPKDAHILFHCGYAKESFQVAGLKLTTSK